MIKLTIFVAAAILFCSCGGNDSSYKKNDFLGEIPSIVKNNISKVEEKEKDIKECTNMDEAFKLNKELKLLKEENKEKILKYLTSSNICGKDIPFEAIDVELFKLNQVLLDTVFTNGRVQFKFITTIKDEVSPQRFTPLVYFKALDKQGNEIAGGKSVAAGSRLDIKPGATVSATGILEGQLLEDFAKIVQITKEEYDKK